MSVTIQQKLTVHSNRVKCVDHHESEPWIVCSLYSGDIRIWNYETQLLVKSLRICNHPVRTAKFVSRKNWVVSGADDKHIRVHNFNTLEKSYSFEAHTDVIRCIEVHKIEPYLLSCSDDLLIKLWNWNQNWLCQQIFEGHSVSIMQVAFNPKDNSTFASASLDTTIKMWQLGTKVPKFTLDGHKMGVNSLSFSCDTERSYLVSGAEDGLVKIWDYQNKTCLRTLEGPVQNVSAVLCHGELPFVFTGYEDGTVSIWHATTFKLKSTLDFALERVWALSSKRGSANIAIGYDEGAMCILVGKIEPAISMKGTKIIWAKHSELKQVNLKTLCTKEFKNSDYLPTLTPKDMGSCDIYPEGIVHDSNGKFVAIYGDGEYTIYTSVALRKKAFGEARQFVWSFENSQYAILQNHNTISVFKNFKQYINFVPKDPIERIFGGHMLGLKSSHSSMLTFYDWENFEIVRCVEIQAQNVHWSEAGHIVCLAAEEKYHVLKYNEAAVATAKQNNIVTGEDGIEDAFAIVDEVSETVTSGIWFGDCFIYTNSKNKIRYNIGGVTVTISHFNNTLNILGYIPNQNQLYLNDNSCNIKTYFLLSSLLEYKTAIVQNDLGRADCLLNTIPTEYRTEVAQFLEQQGFKRKALSISMDLDHQFNLALSLEELEEAQKIAEDPRFGQETKSKTQLSKLAMLALNKGDTELAKTCYMQAQDCSALLLFAMNTGDKYLLEEVAKLSEERGDINIAFTANFILNELDQCLHLLIKSNNIPQAAFFARSYCPSKIVDVVNMWRKSINDTNFNSKIKQMLADPLKYQNLFPEYANF